MDDALLDLLIMVTLRIKGKDLISGQASRK